MENFIHLRYFFASGKRESSAPNSRKREFSKARRSPQMSKATTTAQIKATVKISLPRFSSPSPLALDMREPPPTPNNKPRLKIIVQIGMTIDRAAVHRSTLRIFRP